MKILCFNIEYVGFSKYPKSWKVLAKTGHQIDAIRVLRDADKHQHDLRYYKHIVDTYMDKHCK